jgi:hypothetical protein
MPSLASKDIIRIPLVQMENIVNNLAFSPLNPIVSSIEEKKGTNELT